MEQQIKFSIAIVSEEIEKMLADPSSTHLLYRVIVKNASHGPGVHEGYVIDVVADLQDRYRGLATVSRSPAGIVIHRINS